MSTTITPIDKARLSIFKKMTPATQEVAKEFEGKVGNAATGIIILQYSLGARVKAIVDDEGTYGSGAVKQLAEYLAVKGGESYLYSLMNFSDTFEKDYVKQKSSIAMANGEYMTVTHWLQLMKISEEKAREKMLDRVYKESMSANDLEKEIRAGAGGKTKNARQGGRKPKTPSNPMVGLQGIFALSNKFVRFEEVAEKAVFDVLDEIEPDKVTDNLVEKAEKALEIVEQTVEKANEMKDRLETNLERLKEIREKAAESAAEEYDEEAPKKKSKKDKAHAESNGDGKKKGKKKKSKKPVAAE